MADDNRGSFAAIFGGGYLVYNGVKRILKTRRVQDTASNLIAYAPQGNAEVEGYAWPANVAFKTSAGKLCAYYSCKLQKLVKHGKSSSWDTVWKYAPLKELLILDHTGALKVLTTGAEVTARHKITSWRSVSSKSEIAQEVESSYKKIKTGFFSSDHRLVESYIPIGSPCYAQGELQSKSTREILADQRIRQFYNYVRSKLRGKLHDNKALDANRDGKVTHFEAQMFLYHRARKIIMDNSERGSEKNEELKFYGYMQTSANHKLIVSDMHEHHLLEHLSKWNLLKIIGGAGLVGLGVASLFW